ncbi:MAG TPA: hypothetical protein PKA76_18660 [Pirellulaceae bacterium]|nr:hypothetical protein [Pirellulaceae bacterium]
MRQSTPPRCRKWLKADVLPSRLRNCFELVPDRRRSASVAYPLADCLLAGYVMFSLKDPSLLAFEARHQQHSLNRLYRTGKLPSDMQMREILDPVDLEPLHQAFAELFAEVQRGGLLIDYLFDDGSYLVALDGTGYFCSSQICCPSCLERKTSSGNIQYAHQAVVAVLVHPQRREVIPLGIEPIVKQDGESKNDCERNVSRRLLERLRRQHPRLKMVITEDGLSSNGPHIKDLTRLGFSYILASDADGPNAQSTGPLFIVRRSLADRSQGADQRHLSVRKTPSGHPAAQWSQNQRPNGQKHFATLQSNSSALFDSRRRFTGLHNSTASPSITVGNFLK